MANKWSEIQKKTYPELIPVRFPRGTKARLVELADQTYMRVVAEYERNPNLDVKDLPPLHSQSTLIRKAVLEFLEREEAK